MQPFDVERNKFERGQILSRFNLPKKYPITTNYITEAGKYIDELEISLEPTLPYHYIWCAIESAGNPNGYGKLLLYHNGTIVFNIPWWVGAAGNSGRFGIRPTSHSASTLALHFVTSLGGTISLTPLPAIAIADTGKVFVESIAGAGTSLTINWAILSLIRPF